jgi:Sec-independent protein secretion pathway component TatC
MLALPLCLLYEAGIIVAAVISRPARAESEFQK